MALTLAGCMALAACGPLGDDDAEPTSTSESLAQPTEMATESDSGSGTEEATDSTVPAEVVDDDSTPGAPPVAPDSTPNLEPIMGSSDSTPESTPVFNGIQSNASPVAMPGEATPVDPSTSGGEDDGPPPDGDGTSGGLVVVTEVADDSALEPAETAEVDDGTPSASPVAGAASLDELEVLAVTSCEPETVPEISLDSTSYRTVSDVNVRVGPGADCDQLAISPIGGFMPVTILGGPVQRDGEDFVWVQVEVAGETGWIVTEALEPVESRD